MRLKQELAVPGPQCVPLLGRRNAVVARDIANGPPVFTSSSAGAGLTDIDGVIRFLGELSLETAGRGRGLDILGEAIATAERRACPVAKIA